MTVKQIKSAVFTSNTYCLSDEANCNDIWLVDVGEFDSVHGALRHDQTIKGVFITHPHYDHVYQINALVRAFPNCVVYASESGKSGLYSSKLNLSYYHGNEVEYERDGVQVLKDSDKIEIFQNSTIEVIATPGHHESCLSFKLGNFLFTGDSYIPGVKVVTKLRGGNKSESFKSLEKIKSLVLEKTIICPGHGDMVSLSDSSELRKFMGYNLET